MKGMSVRRLSSAAKCSADIAHTSSEMGARKFNYPVQRERAALYHASNSLALGTRGCVRVFIMMTQFSARVPFERKPTRSRARDSLVQ